MDCKYIFLITIDTLRADHLSCYGYKRETTPFIDSLAKKSWLFKNFFTNGPLTPRSFPSILCSQYAFQYKSGNMDSVQLPESSTLISKVFKKNNYRTACFQAGNPFVSRFYGYSRGFDYFKDYLDTNVALETEKTDNSFMTFLKKIIKKNKLLEKVSRKFLLSLSIRDKIKKIKSGYEPFIRAAKINQDVTNWIEKNKNNKFFMWIHYMDVHQPHFYHEDTARQLDIRKGFSNKTLATLWALIDSHKIPPKNSIEDMIDLYDIEIRYLDNHLKKLFDWLKQKGILSQSLIIITADHGDEFGEHGGLGHMLGLYDEMLHVPLIFYSNGLKPEIFDKDYEMIDLAPTILEMVGLNHESRFKGSAFFMRNVDGTYKKNYIISESLRTEDKRSIRIVAVRTDEWKLIYDSMDENKNELFKIDEDKEERNNVCANFRNTEVVRNLTRIARAHIEDQVSADMTSPEKEWMEQRISRIRKLYKRFVK